MDIRTFFKTKTSSCNDPNNSPYPSNSSVQISDKNSEESSSSQISTDTAGESGCIRPCERIFECVTNKSSTPVDLGTKETGPSQPYLPEYPKTLFGKQNRSFSSDYYKAYSFIEYSKEADAIFCFPCRLFQCSSSGAYRDPAFIANGVCDWKNILAKLQKHADGVPHRQCSEQWHCFEQTKATGSIAAQLSESHRTSVQSNREYAASIVDILLYIGKQGLALRGHDEREQIVGTFWSCVTGTPDVTTLSVLD